MLKEKKSKIEASCAKYRGRYKGFKKKKKKLVDAELKLLK